MECDFCNGAGLQISHEGIVVNLLEKLMRDIFGNVRMMFRIKEAEDFGLGFNCMTRFYIDRYDEEILIDMIKVCEEYLKWFSHRREACRVF